MGTVGLKPSPTSLNLSTLRGLVAGELERRWASTDHGVLVDDACSHAMLPPGKLFRPTLLLTSAIAVGGSADAVMPAALSTELGHTASLVHDDIIDADDMRRGRPSVQSKYGVNTAIVVGDLLIFALFDALAECAVTGVDSGRVVAAVSAVARAGVDLCRGQVMEAEMTGSRRMELAAYEEMVRLKTGALFRAACEAGAILGGGDSTAVAALVNYADHLGIAFQASDDLLGYVSDTARTGKSAASDIGNGRPALPTLLAYNRADDADRRRIGHCLSGGLGAAEALHEMTEICQRTGALAAAAAFADEHAARAVAALTALPAGRAVELLGEYASLSVGRRH